MSPYDCPNCGEQMQDEHAHYRCHACGFLEPCCSGMPGPIVYVPPLPDALRLNMQRRIAEDLCEVCVQTSPESWPGALCDECLLIALREGYSTSAPSSALLSSGR